MNSGVLFRLLVVVCLLGEVVSECGWKPCKPGVANSCCSGYECGTRLNRCVPAPGTPPDCVPLDKRCDVQDPNLSCCRGYLCIKYRGSYVCRYEALATDKSVQSNTNETVQFQ
ncbi:hypothetical protein DdX_15832 [Ditylenchus destructor]|uniref:Uncharacterized protein n=1 Tax=Ditylenchus destructor TaxID=166010 RepID=A0AAD4MUN4_9BILA|nr:hypothetical protein DdX_15832 [Ditylenchus destructor]